MMINSRDAGTKLNSSARSYDKVSTALPHHAWTELRILEFLNQTCDLCLIALWKECIDNGVAERQSFDTLRCPVGGHVLDRNSPDFFRIRLEKSSVEPPPKPSHQPILIVALILGWSKLCPNVGQHAANRFDHSKIFQSVRCFQWIVVVLPLVENATHPRAKKKVFIRQDLMPQVLYFRNFGEEPVAADVKPPAVTLDSLRDSPDHVVSLKDDDLVTPLDCLVGSCKTSGTRPYHHNGPSRCPWFVHSKPFCIEL